ncbi:MAG: molybdopterin-dependent oxidoreductase [Desulfobacteraceae bacterium]|nr:molybdopterin-dependent oxidoreductase [Desulfobacteraceae bacterium]
MLTACTKDCPDCCSIIIDKKSGKPKIMGNPDHPITKGFTCRKVKNHINRLKSPNRITSPILKSGKGFKKISWDEALDICSEKITATLKNNPKKMLHIQDHGARGVTKEVTDNFFTFLGCTKTHGSLCDITGIQACIKDFGALDHNNIDDILNSSHIINFGKDFFSSSIHLSQIIRSARKKNIHVTSIWPGGGDYGKYADKLLRINPGTDRFLALAITKCLIENNNLDQSYIERCTGKKKYFNLVNQSSLTFLSGQCGVSIEDIKFLASIYSKNKVSTIIGWGVQRYLFGMETVRHINALSWLSGNVGYEGAGVYFSISSLRNLKLDWINHKPKSSLLRPILADEIERLSPKIETVWVNCSNIVNQAPDSRHLSKTLKNINFTIVVDAFMNDTAATADLILPCTLMWEEDEVVGSFMHDYLQYAKKAFSPPGECKSDFQIVKELNLRLNTEFIFPEREDCFKLSFPESNTGMSYDTFKNNGFAFAGKHDPAFNNGTEHETGLFSLINTLTKEPEKDPLFPMSLLSLINKDFIHSQILPEEQGSLPVITINPDTEHIKDVDLNKTILLVTCIGKLEVKIKFDKSLHPDVIIYRKGDWMLNRGGVNALIKARLTDSGTGAAYYAQQARLENQ